MVSRIEVRLPGQDWTFARNIMPGSSGGISDPLMDGGEDIISVACDELDESTLVTRLKQDDYVLSETGTVCILKSPDVVLRLGDPHYITTVQSQVNSDRLGLRISHQKSF